MFCPSECPSPRRLKCNRNGRAQRPTALFPDAFWDVLCVLCWWGQPHMLEPPTFLNNGIVLCAPCPSLRCAGEGSRAACEEASLHLCLMWEGRHQLNPTPPWATVQAPHHAHLCPRQTQQPAPVQRMALLSHPCVDANLDLVAPTCVPQGYLSPVLPVQLWVLCPFSCLLPALARSVSPSCCLRVPSWAGWCAGWGAFS